MKAERWRQIEDLLDAVFEREPAERGPLLDRACAGDPDLRREVESLLAHQAPSEKFIESPAFALAADVLGEREGERIENRHFGAYRILREIGRGGMGAVYLAERSDGEFQQKVALKLVRSGLADPRLTRRFRRERQILASLNHPNIARLLDGGVSDRGEPFLVMEFVEGTRIDAYCDEHNLPTAERLNLFLTVCRGVSYAHQHLVVHRDLKPSNILVTGEGVPKLLDFGIAKLLDPELAGDETHTEMRAFTPEYASPEQVSGGQITTASDVYSLGVLLKEMLQGAPVQPAAPLRLGRWLSGGSARVTAAVDAATLREKGGGGAKAVGQATVNAELKNIIEVARREEPARRYASVGQLAEDVQRYLDGKPVRAQKDSFKYRASKFVRRNTLGVAAALIVLLSLFIGVAAVVWQSRQTSEQARIAAQERDRARREAAKAERINSFLQNVLGFSDPTWLSPNPRRKREASVADALDEAGRRAEAELADQPEVLAAVRFTLGWTYKAQSKLEAAEPHLRASLDLRRKALGADHQDTAQSLVGMGELFMFGGKFAEAESLFSEAVAIHRRAREAGEVNAKWFAISLSDLGSAQLSKGDAAAGEASFLEALEVGANVTGPDRALLAVINSNLGVARREKGDLDGATAYTERGLEEYRRLPGEPRWEMGAALGNLAGMLALKGEYGRAESLARESLDVYINTVGETHQYSARSLLVLSEIYCGRGDYGGARKEVERAIRIQQRVLADSHIDFTRSWVVLGNILTRSGAPSRGEAYLRRALELRSQTLKPGHWMIGDAQGALGENLTAQKRYGEAEPLLSESYRTLDAGLGKRDSRTQEALRRLVTLYEAWQKPDRAAHFREPLSVNTH